MSDLPEPPDSSVNVSSTHPPTVSVRTDTTAKWESIPFAIHSAILDALDHAENKHPSFADSNKEAAIVLAEELFEVNVAGMKVMQNISDQASRDNLYVELAQAAAVCIRAMKRILDHEDKN